MTRLVYIAGGAVGLVRAVVRGDSAICTLHWALAADGVVLLRNSSASANGCPRAAGVSHSQDSGCTVWRGAGLHFLSMI